MIAIAKISRFFIETSQFCSCRIPWVVYSVLHRTRLLLARESEQEPSGNSRRAAPKGPRIVFNTLLGSFRKNTFSAGPQGEWRTW
jgi:hypothetical protein